MADVARIAEAYQKASPGSSEAVEWGRMTALPLIEGFTAFWRGDYRTAVEVLHGSRFIANGFGGSHAQRDVIDWTLTEAAIRGGLGDVASALANERIAVKPHSPVNRGFVLRAQSDSARLRSAAAAGRGWG